MNNKKNNTEIVVDLTNATSAADVYAAFGEAKINKYLTTDEKNAIFNKGKIIVIGGNKKPSLLKRFWNWVTRKK